MSQTGPLGYRRDVTASRTAIQRWRPTPTLLQALATAVLAGAAAALTRRVDLLVLATPFVVVLAWSLATRPTRAPRLTVELQPAMLHEGGSTRWSMELTDVGDADQVVTTVEARRFLDTDPPFGEIVTPVDGDTARQDITVRALRWGAQRLGGTAVTAVSPWNAYRFGPIDVTPPTLQVTPGALLFDLDATTPHPQGLVGQNRSRRRGDGSEFADIRPFQAGDRLRRIHWPVSARTGELHVRTTYAEEDAEVHLVLDASADVGTSEGVDGAASSLDRCVRAAAALAQHLLRRGERVELTVHAPDPLHVPLGVGLRQHRRILDTLSRVHVDVAGLGRRTRRPRPLRAGPGALVIVLTPLVDEEHTGFVLRLAAHGHSVIVVDCLPPDARIGRSDDPLVGLAWRLRQLERGLEIDRIRRLGLPVVPWRGPGSLDQVLRQLSARPRPRVRAR